MIHIATEHFLTDSVFPELAQALKSRLPRIISGWADVVRQSLPAAENLTKSQLHDSVPALLEDLVAVLSTRRLAPAQQFATDSPEHGRVRYEQNFDLMQVLVEYSLLRRAVLEETIQGLGRPATLDELTALSTGMDVLIRRAVTTFVDYLKLDIEASAEAQSKYLSFLSHDLRGGLNGILLMIEVLKRELSTAPQFAGSIEDLDLMRRSILDTVSTMDRFLHAERFLKGKIQVRPAKLSLPAFLTDQVNQIAYQARERTIDVRTDFKCQEMINGDKELLAMIVSNVLANAVKFSRGGVITVRCTETDATHVRISVADQGPGIPPDRLSKIFAPFVRGDTHGEQGVGLGLSIARQASDLLGATLTAESVVGAGTTFHLDLAHGKTH